MPDLSVPPQPQTHPVPPPSAFINHSGAAGVTYFFVRVLTELQPAAALGSGMWPPLTLTFPTSLLLAVTQQPPITNDKNSPGLHLAPLLNPHWSINHLWNVLTLPRRHNEVVYILSQWADTRPCSDCWTNSETHLPFSILTATVTASLGLSLSMPSASAITTWPKQPSPRGLPKVNLQPPDGGKKRGRKPISCENAN